MLFRRRTQGKEGTGGQSEVSGPGSRAEGPPTTAPPNVPRSATKSETTGRPPPLPERPTESGAGITSPEPSGRCFVCGSTLESGTCPVCRIAWVE